MRQIKLIVYTILIFTILISFNTIYGTGDMLNTIFNSGSTWLGNAIDQNSVGLSIANYIKGDLFNLVKEIGNLIFFIVAAFLGVKYIWSGVTGKSQVKETLPTFIVGATFFYSAQLIFDVFNGEFDTLFQNSSYTNVFSSIWATVVIIVQILAISGIVAIGLKYMISSADTRADIKKDLLPMVLGLIFVFSISKVLTFIVDVGQELFT
ncbi:MAG: hypothetical protein PHD15_01220 [Clostridia bacterium]|nr:hypothetical protein [Clostridia bacterium]MDD4386370.1 hypothetical protein [Clostridia bacterium]